MPPLIIPSPTPSTGTGLTLLRARNRLADELGFYHATTVSDTGDNGDAARVVIADEFRDDEIGYEWMGMWLYAQNGAQAGFQRRIVSQSDAGYLGSLGAAVLSRPFAAALVTGTTVEITNPLPVKRHLAVKGLNECLNEGLSRIWTEVRLTVTGNGTYTYSLASYPWLTRYEQTRGIYDYRTYGITYPTTLSVAVYRFAKNGAGISLVTNVLYTSAETFELAVLVRADRYVYNGSSWSYVTTPGLQADDWQAAVPEEWSVAFAMVQAIRFLIEWTERDEKLSDAVRNRRLANLSRRLAQWASTAAAMKKYEFPQPMQEPTESLVYVPVPAVWTP